MPLWWLKYATHWPWFLKLGLLNFRQPPFLHWPVLVGGPTVGSKSKVVLAPLTPIVSLSALPSKFVQEAPPHPVASTTLPPYEGPGKGAGAGDKERGAVVFASSASQFLFALPIALWSDRGSRVRVGAFTLLWFAAVVPLMGLAHSVWVFTGLAVQLTRRATPAAAMRLFSYSITYIALLFGAMALDQLLRSGL